MQIFYLETNEEVPSVIERIRTSDQPEVALVAPVGALLLQSVVNLKLVKREAEKLSKTLFLVTTDKIGRNLASQVGLTVYERIEKGKAEGKAGEIKKTELETNNKIPDSNEVSGVKIHRYYTEPVDDPKTELPLATEKVDSETVLVKEYGQRKEINDSPKRTAFKRSVKKFILTVILLVLLAGIGGSIWALPLVNLDITVKAESVERNLDFDFTTDGANDSLKGKKIETEKSASKKVNSTGTKDIGEKSKGSVTIYNEYSSSAQPLQAGTRMQTSNGKVYRLDSDIVVPGGEFEVEGSTARLTKAGTTQASASADQPGDSYNTSAVTLTIPGIGRDNKIYAKTSGLAGGISKTVKIISSNDISDAKIDLTNDLTGQVQADVANQSAGLTTIDSSMEKNLTAFSTDKSVNTEADNFTANATIKIHLLAYSKDDLRNYIIKKMEKELKSDQSFVIDESSLKVTASAVNLNNSTAKIQSSFKGKIVSKIDEIKLKRDLEGQSFSEVSKTIKALPQFSDYKLAATPSWWFSRLPSRPASLKMQIKYE